jgi:hypothetical protein
MQLTGSTSGEGLTDESHCKLNESSVLPEKRVCEHFEAAKKIRIGRCGHI